MALMRLRLEIASYSQLLRDITQGEHLDKLLEFINEDEASGLTIKSTVSPVSATSHLIHSAAFSCDLLGESITDTNTRSPTQTEDFVSCYANPTPRPSEDLESALSSPSRQLEK